MKYFNIILPITSIVMAVTTIISSWAAVQSFKETKRQVDYQVQSLEETKRQVDYQVQSLEETKKLIDYQTRIDIFFKIFPHALPRERVDNIFWLNFGTFQSDPFLIIEITNRSFKPIKIFDIVASGSCLDLNQNTTISLLSDNRPSIKPGEDLSIETNVLRHYLKDTKLPCETDFLLETDFISKSDKIILK